MSPVEAFKKVLVQNYCNFKGRASRSEFWWYSLIYYIIYAVVSGIAFSAGDQKMMLGSIVGLIFLLPTLGVTWRRLHDGGKSGAWFLINIIPIIGQIWFLILLVKASEPQSNRYGDVPQD